LAAQPFAVRVFGDQRLELADQVGMAAERKICFETLLDGRQSQVLEASDLGLCERFECELRECWAAPEGERFVQETGGACRIASREGLATVGQQKLEGVQIKLTQLELEQVAGRLGEQRV
jgi:hypothetical protein